MESSNRTTVLAYVNAFNRGDLDTVCAQFTPDAQIWGVLGWGGMDKVRPIWKDLMECNQMQLEVVAIVEQNDAVAIRFIERGKSVKPFMSNPATGKTYEVIAMEWFEMKDGKIHRRWGARDSASISRQLGWQIK